MKPKHSLNTGDHTCLNCGASFRGKVCNHCGEKVFHPSQLGVRNFLHQAIEVFTHFENKVLKSIWLTLRRPGYITKQNLRGIRVPYANPVQLFIIVNLLFYIIVSGFKRNDYTPFIGDANSNTLSSYPYLKWARPWDKMVASRINSLHERKLGKFKKADLRESVIGKQITDSSVRNMPEIYAEPVFLASYTTRVAVYSKTLIFILIPVFALVFHLVFLKRLKYYGAALILATHFLAFNLLLHSLLIVLNFAPWQWFHSATFYCLPFKASTYLFYNDWLAPFSNIFLGIYDGFEAIHIIFFWLWLYFAFKRLFDLRWWHNLIISYLFSRLFFLIIFSFYKKFLIAFALWNM